VEKGKRRRMNGKEKRRGGCRGGRVNLIARKDCGSLVDEKLLALHRRNLNK